MCSFSAKGPWVVVVDGVPYGAYTEGQATRVAGLLMAHDPTRQVVYFKMLKYDDAGEDYDQAILDTLRGQAPA